MINSFDYTGSGTSMINIGSTGYGGYANVTNRKKEGSVDPSLPVNPDDIAKRPGWKETTHPDAGKRGHRTFENEKTGEKLRHDEGRPGQTGHEGHDHYHCPNPNKTNWADEYLDAQGNPVPDGHDRSHIYSPEKSWWK